MKRILWLFITILSLGTILGACGGKNDGDEASSGKDAKQEITMNAKSEPPSMDPALATDTTSGWVMDHVFEGLYTRDQDGKTVPGLAEEAEVSEDGKTHTFKIREDAKWSDGSPLTANDFEFAWKHVLNPDTGSSFAFYLYYIEGAEEYNKGKGTVEDVAVKALDERTLEVTLNAPLGYFDTLLTMWTFYPVKEELVSSDANWAAEADTYVSNGPFKMTGWSHDSELVIEKNDEYYKEDEVKLDKITFKMIGEATTAYQMYKTDELDFMMTLPTDAIESEKGNEDFEIVPYYGTYMYMFNVEKEPFTNEKIRKAFGMAVDRKVLSENVTLAGEIPAYAMVPEGADTPKGDFREEGGDYFKEDIDEAKKLLKEGMEEEGWSTLPAVTLLYNTDENHKKIAEAAQEMFKQNLGVEIKLANQEWKTYLETTKTHNFQMARMGWIGVFVDPVVNLDYFLGDSPNNRTGWVNEEFDRIMAESKVEQDQEKRYEMLHQAEEILMEDFPMMPIHFYTNTYLMKTNIKGSANYVNRYPFMKWAEVEAK
ncbi:peptide ABC transporter substrate-binding protein [Sporosarcina sp. P26b]|uniref:peptide ABC transporter substrate-binding protein n=1 Tax=Sporosarcina TaxID=1569 RepID=UPI000A17E845|nr:MULTISPECIES: peptide ABC transporter substrate-binding protein [Sporosarcina]ARK21302.1 ABC transporter substrate-binding protein [Sporosarcina ureae]PIC95474.1 peptide ABC transporter substrate-binding protein [Sporosarcina sp. P26b]